MLKPKVIDAKDSNIANLGSQMEKDARKAAASTEVEFKGAGAKPGVEIWRVEKLAIKKVPKECYGQFYSGDSYIILYTYKQGNSDKLLFNIHFWLGTSTSQDEAGVAAYKTVELDDFLGTLPVQFREVQGHESETFLGYFNNKLRILEGGIDSGFFNVKTEEYKPRLLHIKGKKNIRVTEVKLARESLNKGDSFILDAGLKLWQWNGPKAGVAEKSRANSIVKDIDTERFGKPVTKILDGDEDDAEFWKLLGGKGDIKDGADADDEVKEFSTKLYKLSDASGSLKLTEVASGALSKKSLDANDVFIVDIGHTVYVWVGSKASAEERKKAVTHAVDYLAKQGRPAYTPVTRIIDGGETESFRKAFTDF